MVQSLNTKAIFTLASVIRRPGLLIPHLSVASVSDLDYHALRLSANIKAVIFDKDNTLTAPYIPEVHPSAELGLKNVVHAFGPESVAILSNSAGTLDDEDYRDAIAIESSMGIAVIRHDEKKPGGLKQVLEHFQLEDPAQLCMVGDRVLTDVVFGNLHGMLTVHCEPVCSGRDNQRDNWTAKLLRPIENKLIYGRMGMGWSTKPHKFWPGPEECPLLLPPSLSGRKEP